MVKKDQCMSSSSGGPYVQEAKKVENQASREECAVVRCVNASQWSLV